MTNELAFFFDACRRGNEEDVRKVCTLVPELINERDAKGYSALIISAYNNQPSIVSILIEHGADIDAGDASGNTALMGAAFRGYKEIVQILIDAGADVNLRNGQGAPALTFAATFGQLAIAEILLHHGADLHLTDTRGKTPMDHALIQENEEMVEMMKRYS